MALIKASTSFTRARAVDRAALEENAIAGTIGEAVKYGHFDTSVYISEEFQDVLLPKLRQLGYDVTEMRTYPWDVISKTPVRKSLWAKFLGYFDTNSDGAILDIPIPTQVTEHFNVSWANAKDILPPGVIEKASRSK